MVSSLHLHNFPILPLKSVIPNFVACLVFLRMSFSFIKLISSSGTSTKSEAAAIFTSAEVIIAEYDAILSQWEHANFYNHLSNYTKGIYHEVPQQIHSSLGICGKSPPIATQKTVCSFTIFSLGNDHLESSMNCAQQIL